MLSVLFLGDVVGEPGRSAVIARLPELKSRHALDFVIVNGENAAGGRGITGKITIDLLRAGVSVITTGDHIWDQKEILSFIDTEPRLLRPVNYPDGAPGSGSIVLETAKGKIGVINVQARTFMQPILENPFRAVEAAVTKRQRTSLSMSTAKPQVRKSPWADFSTGKFPLSSALTLMFRRPTNKSSPGAQLSSAMPACADRSIPSSGALSIPL